jgi:peptidase E
MTKFILLGGYPAKAADGGKEFAEALVEGCGASPKLLICLFARAPETWEKTFQQERESFTKYLPSHSLDIRLADPKTFAEQVSWADAIYMRGGVTDTLISILSQNPEWQQHLDGKTLAGSSAGADAIATHHYNLDTRKIGSGLGLLSVKMIPHWKSNYCGPEFDWEAAYAKLKNYGDALPVVTLAEGQFEIHTK